MLDELELVKLDELLETELDDKLDALDELLLVSCDCELGLLLAELELLD